MIAVTASTYRAPIGVAHRSGTAHLDARTVSSDRSVAQANPLRYASASGSSDVERKGNCPSTRRAVRFYRAAYVSWRAKMGAAETGPSGVTGVGCPRYLAALWQRKAHAARKAYERWHRYHYDWRSWLPAKWYRIARCETGVRWDWNSGTYQGAFGFYHGSWDAFRLPGYPSEAYLATPRQQYEVALAIWRRYGFSGWGCRGA